MATICLSKVCFFVIISTFLCSMLVDGAPAGNKKSMDWRHLIGKRSADKKSSSSANDKTVSNEKSQKSTEGIEVVENRKGDDDIDEETERTVDWRLLGDSNDLNAEMAARRRRRSILQSTNANRQRSRTANVNQRNKYHQQQRMKNKNTYRIKRSSMYGDDTQQISESDLEKLAYLVSELQQLNEEERRLEDEDDTYPPSDEMYYYPQSSYHPYQSISPQVNDDDIALLAQWWRAQQRKLADANRYVRKRSTGPQYYAPARYEADNDLDNEDDDTDDDDDDVPVQVVLLNPAMLDNDVDDDDDDDQDEIGNRYDGYPIVVPNDAIESMYPYDRSNPTYYAYDVDDAGDRRSDEIELEKRITSLARYLNTRSRRR